VRLADSDQYDVSERQSIGQKSGGIVQAQTDWSGDITTQHGGPGVENELEESPAAKCAIQSMGAPCIRSLSVIRDRPDQWEEPSGSTNSPGPAWPFLSKEEKNTDTAWSRATHLLGIETPLMNMPIGNSQGIRTR